MFAKVISGLHSKTPLVEYIILRGQKLCILWSEVLEWSEVRFWSGKSRMECSCDVCEWPSFMYSCNSNGSVTHTQTYITTALHSTFATLKSDSTPLQYSAPRLHSIEYTVWTHFWFICSQNLFKLWLHYLTCLDDMYSSQIYTSHINPNTA